MRAGRVTRPDPARIVSAMSDFSYSRAGRLASEFIVIVIGVLVALVLESWWSDREERRYEAELREDMVAEFRENLAVLDSDLDENAAASAVVNRYAGITDAGLEMLPDSAFALWSSGGFAWAGFDPAMGNVQALVQSGNLGAIRDRELRLMLSRWAGLLDEKVRYNAQAVDFQVSIMLPSAFRMGADLSWGTVERRELRSQLLQFQGLMQAVIRNQANLRDTAADILNYLES
jgi:hypothetical protein